MQRTITPLIKDRPTKVIDQGGSIITGERSTIYDNMKTTKRSQYPLDSVQWSFQQHVLKRHGTSVSRGPKTTCSFPPERGAALPQAKGLAPRASTQWQD